MKMKNESTTSRLVHGAPALVFMVGIVLALSLLVVQVVPAQDSGSATASAEAAGSEKAKPAYNEGQAAVGRSLYNAYCKSCHGDHGKGDGMLSESLSVKPTNLTLLTAQYDGAFPADIMAQVIDGRKKVPGHTTSADMPAWGDAFSRASDDADEAAVKQKIDNLVQYLHSIQADK